jgi:hypothetical protein
MLNLSTPIRAAVALHETRASPFVRSGTGIVAFSRKVRGLVSQIGCEFTLGEFQVPQAELEVRLSAR